MFAGVGALACSQPLRRSAQVAPCVVFIDEIDALGKKRGRSDDSASADADQMLNQLLIEMDGFDQTVGIVVLASTNRPDVLDSALLRPGRFDRQITRRAPRRQGARSRSWRSTPRRSSSAPSVDLGDREGRPRGYTGADLARLLNEAAILATREGVDCGRLAGTSSAPATR